MPRRNRPPTTLPAGRMTRGEADLMLMREIVNLFAAWEGCYRACRRHKSCVSPTVHCFDHNIETVREGLRRLADWPRLDGPREPDELAAPVDDLFD
jgi:hypothetical protein